MNGVCNDFYTNGGSYLISDDNYNDFIADMEKIGRPDGQFMTPSNQMDELLKNNQLRETMRKKRGKLIVKIFLRYRTCEITFSEKDPFYAGKTVEIHGESPDDFTFYIYKSEKLYWTVPSPENSDRNVGISVDDSEKEKLLAYVIKKAQSIGYKFVLW